MLINENNYVEEAEKVIKLLSEKKDQKGRPVSMVTTSKIRNLLAMVSDTYNDALNLKGDKLSEELIGQINYMKIRFYYEAGREPKVKELLEKAKVFDIMKQISNSRENYILFSRYMEALVAFRKFYGGKDE
jgi:CRISPR-associated protein Csm2